ncbi:MAG: TlpA family protein disulfide reductase [Gammaproteobacteria bacterium]|nr:TlpA family protein disulfide reductase [Gammaproteobacteria bacterium]
MNKRQFLKCNIAAAACGAGLTALSPSALGQSGKKYGIEGQPAPEIKLDYWIDQHGEPTSFSVVESRGKWVFLKCFQNWCPGCHSSGFPTLKAFAEEFHDNPKVAIAGIQTVFEGYRSNTLEDVRKLQQRYELPIIMGHDPGDEKEHLPPITMLNYRTGGTPWLILINPEGQVVFNDFHVNREKLIEFVKEQVT